jgi:hypothetical protein
MITAEQSKALVKAGLAHVCEVFGKFKNVNGEELTKADAAKVEDVMSGQKAKKIHK